MILILLLPTGLFAGVAFNDSIFDYQNKVIDFSEYGIQENVRSGEAVEISIQDLDVGDVFVDVDGTALKVKSVTEVDGEIIIDEESFGKIRDYKKVYDNTIGDVLDK